jgi:glyceraldehyde-3-phosphate dehydrogenase (NADP+)
MPFLPCAAPTFIGELDRSVYAAYHPPQKVKRMALPFILAGQKELSPQVIEVRSPYDGRIVAEVSQPSWEHGEKAAAAASESFSQTRRMPSYKKFEILSQVSHRLREHKEEFAQTLCQEAGKPIRDARSEVDRATSTFEIAAEEAKRIGGQVLPLDIGEPHEGRIGIARRFPIGPILAITPFNFPLNLAAHKLAPAAAAGNPVVLKPSIVTPLCALKLGDLLLDAGWPGRALSVLPFPPEDAEKLARDDRFAMLTFTGSDSVGWHLKTAAGRKKVALELGGNAAVVVHEDADLEQAASACCRGAFYYAGQSCISVQRIFVHAPAADSFTALFLEKVKGLKLGDPSSEDTDLGPMISEAAAARAEEWIKEAICAGARLLCGGSRKAALMEPTVLADASPHLRVCSEEVFAPIVVISRCRTFEEAIEQVNNSRYGLQAGVFTRDAGRIFGAFERLEVGGVIINDAPTYRCDAMPYGGTKASGVGREGPRYAIEEMTEPRIMVLSAPVSAR